MDFRIKMAAIFLRLLVMSEVKVITEMLKITAQCNYRHSEEGVDDAFPKEQAVSMWSPKLTSGTTTSPSAAREEVYLLFVCQQLLLMCAH